MSMELEWKEPCQERHNIMVYQMERRLSTTNVYIGSKRSLMFPKDTKLGYFKRTFNGFVVDLSDNEAHKIAEVGTSHHWDFMGFTTQVQRTTIENDIIIGMLDTGIWPESESFNDEGFGPPPRKWKGSYRNSSNFICNKDSSGQGTHTASTASGNLVTKASLNGLGMGTARGGVPSSRIAVYKVCWSDGCYEAAVLAAFDDAIADGVDIISVSLGFRDSCNYFNNSVAIGAFHALRHGILTSSSAGNSGPGLSTINNFDPWSLSVAASTIDRKFFTRVQLGNNHSYEGVSVNTFDLKKVMYPVIYGGNAPNTTGSFNNSISRLCSRGSLDANLVEGKIVVCDALINRNVPFLDGAAGTLVQSGEPKDVAITFPLPASHLSLQDDMEVLFYINSTNKPTATIFKSHEGNDTLAPYVVSFSSRGPNPVTPNILKPDIAAPGVDILASWPLHSPVTNVQGDNRIVPFNILSGTSMACPHATGVAAYVKSHHPTWSPAAIKSALMTTPDTNMEAELAYGAGHINPAKAIIPGLIYDTEPIDFIKFLCAQGYSTHSLQLVTGDNSSCSEVINGTVWDLNYPSFAVSSSVSDVISRDFRRVVTNVGSPNSTYKASVFAPRGLHIQVTPSILSFSSINQKLNFVLTIEGTVDVPVASASLVWDDGVHQVRSPIAVHLV
ncbi:hypothetical protein K2173_004989 [Erythroxylum novogranatense]|uniref:Cucumisin n=1 Tax=Erythroxylum novogranatense TaxID=1862640 RepID=A0AAV8TD89_9ROSI|nr:hypothetical protein K2173_004989 [Erythroxylum novogranatense]